MNRLSLIVVALVLTSPALAGKSLSYTWQWRGPQPYAQAALCLNRYTYGDPSPSRVRAYSSTLTSRDGRVSTTSTAVYGGNDSSRVAGLGVHEGAPEACLRKHGYTLDASIANPWDNPDYVRDFPGIIKSPQQIADEEAADRAKADAKAAKQAADAADFAARDANARKALNDYCASLSKTQRESDAGRRNCPSDRTR